MENRFSKFTVLISNINRYINRIKSEEMLSFGLRSVHVSCLFYLFKNENGLTASELCSMCEEDKGAISRSLEFLEENNYIICEQSDKKKYRAKLYLTDRGKEIGARILEISDNAVPDGAVPVRHLRRGFYGCSCRSLGLRRDRGCREPGHRGR